MHQELQNESEYEPNQSCYVLTRATTSSVCLCPLPSPHSEVRDGVVVGLEDLGVVENLVSERVEPVQGHSDVGGRHPVL